MTYWSYGPADQFLLAAPGKEDRAEYEDVFIERSGRYMDEGFDEAKADERALDDLGCLEFWHFVRVTDEWREKRKEARRIGSREAA